MTMLFRHEGDGIIESWASLGQAVKNQMLHRIAGHVVCDKITEVNGRFEFYFEKEDGFHD
jgi:hypothetical protein